MALRMLGLVRLEDGIVDTLMGSHLEKHINGVGDDQENGGIARDVEDFVSE
jgi:hypothetical protein